MPKFIGVRTPITLDLRAAAAGWSRWTSGCDQGGTRVSVAQQTFSGAPAGNEQRVELIVAGGTLGLREGAATLEVRARDGFWRPDPRGRPPIRSVPVMLDFTPPTLEILASTRYLAQRRRRARALRAKGASRVGVNVGGMFFPGFAAGAPESACSPRSDRAALEPSRRAAGHRLRPGRGGQRRLARRCPVGASEPRAVPHRTPSR